MSVNSESNLLGDLLVVDDDSNTRELIVEHLRSRGLRVSSAADGRAALGAIEHAPFQYGLIVTDLQLPGADGLAVLKKAKQLNPACHVVVMTGYATLDCATDAVRFGAYDYLTKPFSLGQLDVIISRICDREALELKNRQLTRQIGDREYIHSRFDALEGRLDRIERLLHDLAEPR